MSERSDVSSLSVYGGGRNGFAVAWDAVGPGLFAIQAAIVRPVIGFFFAASRFSRHRQRRGHPRSHPCPGSTRMVAPTPVLAERPWHDEPDKGPGPNARPGPGDAGAVVGPGRNLDARLAARCIGRKDIA